jgi:hypothetical protein
MDLFSSVFPSVVDLDRCLDHSSSVTLIQLFLNMSVHSYTLCCGKILSLHSADSLIYFYTSFTFSPQKSNYGILVYMVSGSAILMSLVVEVK